MALAGLLYVFGIVLMLCTDAQKFFTLKHKSGLLSNGLFNATRNANYLGEIMLYASFNIIAQVEIVWYHYLFVWSVIFTSRMLFKDLSNSKKAGWEEYKNRTWLLLPKLFSSSVLSIMFYACLGFSTF